MPRGWKGPAPPCTPTPGDAHEVSLTGRQCWLLGPSTLSSHGGNAGSSCSSSSFSCISRNTKVKNCNKKKFKAVPDDLLPVRFKLQEPGLKLCPDLVQTLHFCFCWTDVLPFPPSHFSTSPVLLSLPTMEKILTKGRSGSSRAGAVRNGLKLRQDFSSARPAHGTASGAVEASLGATASRQPRVLQSFQHKSAEDASAKSTLVHNRD